MADPAKQVFRFGLFEADTSSRELRKAGVRLRLQDQPFQVLVTLLERSGGVVTRDELRQKLWPADTFVDFDHSLNTIMNKLREVLGDSASNPRFIETLAKRGYRFLVPVEAVASPTTERRAAIPGVLAGDSVATRHDPSEFTTLLTHPEEVPSAPQGYVRILFALLQVMYLCFYVVTLARLSFVEDLLEQGFGRPAWITTVLLVSAIIAIPIRLYLLTGVSFNVKSLSRKFLKLFPAVLVLDAIWSLSPFLLAPQIGLGMALGVTAALIYVPFAQRTLLLMGERSRSDSNR
jgi:DNA-binding winged helix-turn-helix (wHTH) protein